MKDDARTSHDAFWTEGEDRPSRWLITCDHATNRVPGWINGGDLGIAPSDMARHIAYDVGAAGVARHLGVHLNTPVAGSDFSRLVIDPNRGEDDPTLLMRLYDGTVIPANRDADRDEKARRLARLYRPYHDTLARISAARPDRAICAIHSFTPQLRGRPPRPWQVAVLYSPTDERLAPLLIERCRQQGWETGDNEPYSGHLAGDSMDRHALAQGRPHVLIEIRNDLIADEAGQAEWAERLSVVMDGLLDAAGL
ncbi:Predicted N-formylglutamate amidohydrolase [Paracoccus isoporae]|uniref:Predicted N-formylglutamate amidohydrolase n=1 Tax=Paracoccus isoporae TaxID=591205 RepID=A0A1G7DZM5_9RHOB|nr:N-formylglutamate amidohydrolase [Paracoccus isoporae]SDE56822.1 Predicted N-formylglutamate amidohydrolase [Paracoccus isoporae]